MYEITQKIMRKNIPAQYASDSHYWERYPGLFEGKFHIEEGSLNHEINKYTLCDNSYAKNKYNWEPKVSLEEGLIKLVEEECKLLKLMEKEI